MQERLLRFATRLRPALDNQSERDRLLEEGEILSTLIVAPFALAGLLWLFLVTDLALLRAEAPALALFLALGWLLRRYSFYLFQELEPGELADYGGSLEQVIFWSAALLFGPSALWLALPSLLWGFFQRWRELGPSFLWNRARNLVIYATHHFLAPLLALELYRAIGGRFPLPGLELIPLFQGLVATLGWFLLSRLAWLPSILFWNRAGFAGDGGSAPFFRFLAAFLLWPLFVDPFAVLAAGLYVEHGVGIFLFFAGGLLLASLVLRQMGKAAERSEQRSRELARLEELGRALISAPPDGSTLPTLLAAHVPGMFPNSEIEIRLFPFQTLLHVPPEQSEAPEALWEWVRGLDGARHFPPGSMTPWGGAPTRRTQLLLPIAGEGGSGPRGGIFLEIPSQGVGPVGSVLPAAKALAASIASALDRVAHTKQMLAHERVEQELALAGAIQSSFLPTELPALEGWELAVTLIPARQTSGDFCDWIPLPGGRLGLVMADVADKGLGAALFMALSRTLLRTYASEHPAHPEEVLAAANRRILSDTHSSMFVTVFYGILDPATGTLIYCNAGHNPPYVVRAGGGEPLPLGATGLPLGILVNFPWQQGTVRLEPGDQLLLYTDGITEAQDEGGAFFGSARLLELAGRCAGQPAHELQRALLDALSGWMGEAPQYDDLTLMVLGRHDGG